MPRPLRLTAAVLVSALLATACGSSTRVESETHTTTVGQELLDLQRAFDSGVITEDEYRRTKNDILRRYDR
jgi:hypothetical protein